MMRRLLLLTISLYGLKLSAYTTDNFIAQMRESGYDVRFIDQHENIILFLIGIILIYVASRFIEKRDLKSAIYLSGIMLSVFASINMILGVPYDEYLIYAVPISVLISILTYIVLFALKSFDNVKLFLNIPIFIGAIILMWLWNSCVDYNVCDKNVQWPSEYGLQWRPIYEGFTDKNYYKSIERNVDSTDSGKILEKLLCNESHTIDHPFDILRSKGWHVGKTERIQFFVNPDCEMGYIQILNGGGLEPYQMKVVRMDDVFGNIDLCHLREIHLIDYAHNGDLVAVTEDSDSTYLYVSYDKNIREGFVCVSDSITLLPEWWEINPYESISGNSGYQIKPDYYVSKEYLSFPSDTIRKIEFDNEYGFIIRFNNPDALDKLYSLNTFALIRKVENYYGNHGLM